MRRGTVVTLRDVTELQSLTGELDSERGFTQALQLYVLAKGDIVTGALTGFMRQFDEIATGRSQHPLLGEVLHVLHDIADALRLGFLLPSFSR